LYWNLLIAFVSGIIWGSFLEVVVSRLKFVSHKGLRLNLGGYSFCSYCRHRLYVQDLVPLISFLLLGGKCRYCQQPIGWRVLLIELFSGLVFALSFWQFGFSKAFIFACFLTSFLLVVAFYDLRKMVIPDEFILIIFGLWLVKYIFKILPLANISIWQSLLGGVLVFILFWSFYLFSQGKWFGFGDAKLGGVLGLFLGWKLSVIFVWLAFVLGGIVAVFLLLLKIKERQSLIPFAPFLIFSFFVLYFFPQARDFLLSFL